MNNELLQKITDLVMPIVDELSYELYHIEFVKENGDFYLRIYIDKENDRISLNDCEAVSRRVSDILDVEDPIKDPYYLEVSSPGIYRNLYITEHFKRYTGSEISVKLTSAVDGSKAFKGILINANDDEITIKKDENSITIPRQKIKQANLEGEI